MKALFVTPDGFRTPEPQAPVWACINQTNRAGTELYAMGWTQHTIGTQNIRAMCVIQLLLGNMGIAGGGINALRGESNVQGSTDHGLLFHILPGYLPVPTASIVDLKTYVEKLTPKTKDPKSVNWWGNRPKYITSYLKAIYGNSATAENDFGYAWLPKLDEGMNCSWLMLFDKMLKGNFEGFFAWGQNPACSGSNAGKVRKALANLKWMVNVNLFDNETGSFWKAPGLNSADIKTEVFMLPASSSVEKEGSLSNSSRLAQWREKAIMPIAESKPDSEIMNELYFRVKLYKKGRQVPEPIMNLLGLRRKGAVQDQGGRYSQCGEGDQRILPRRRLRQKGHSSQTARQKRRTVHQLCFAAG
jgi:formate dehydrogenase major subunit